MSKYIGHPAFRVHTQSGAFKGAIKGRMVGHHPARYRVGVDTGTAPHAVYVIQGTRVMLGRDVLWDTATAKGTQEQIYRRGVKHMQRTLRAQSFRTAGNAQDIARNMATAALNMRLGAVLATNIMGGTLLERIKANVSMRDHTLQDLALLDHPYARRHGSIRIHT
jgi:hypothetical protein